MLSQVRRLVWFAVLAAALSESGVSAQSTPLAPARTNFLTPPREEEPEEKLPDVFSTVAFIDSALPRNMVRTRFDWAKRFRRPTLAEHFQPKGGLPFSPGPRLPETNVDYMDLATHVEWSPDTWLSIFFESPIRMVNPDQNPNIWGQGDANLGFKLGVYADERFLTTFQLRIFAPTAGNSALGTSHISVEPGLLASYRFLERFQLEGEARYWMPLGGDDFAGDVLRYGLGLSYGHPAADVVWLAPVIEVVGWSIQDARALAVAPGFVGIEEVSGQTIVNAQAGLRVGFGLNADLYAGYSRCLTGPTWYRDMVRVELRWLY